MIITSLVDNFSRNGICVEHGLSLYIQTVNGKNILFDMGQGHLYAENASKAGLSLQDIDMSVISHGHYDHGGGIADFLHENRKAPVYIRPEAFQPCYSIRDNRLRYLGIDPALASEKRIVFCSDRMQVSNDVMIFGNVKGKRMQPPSNRFLIGADKVHQDLFLHEQHLIIQEGNLTFLFCGCAHSGILNIIDTATEIIGHEPTHVIGGMHLSHSPLSQSEERKFIESLSRFLLEKRCHYITMHCTGLQVYKQLSFFMHERISYLSCGDTVNINTHLTPDSLYNEL